MIEIRAQSALGGIPRKGDSAEFTNHFSNYLDRETIFRRAR
jgi:hypothetical protein